MSEEDVKIPAWMLAKQDYEEYRLAFLLLEDVIFTNEGKWMYGWDKEYTTLHVNCNDVFAWGCADAEDILRTEINELYEMHAKHPQWASAVWCIKKRQEWPQKPVEDAIRKDGFWDLDAILPKKS
jgi:hypothetical protein